LHYESKAAYNLDWQMTFLEIKNYCLPLKMAHHCNLGGMKMHREKDLWITRAAMLFIVAVIVWLGNPVTMQKAAAQTLEEEESNNPCETIIGEWWTEGREGRIRFKQNKKGDFYGITTWRKHIADPNEGSNIDIHNPDPKKRGRSLAGITLIWNLKYDEDGEYTDGYVYNPLNGKTYRMKISVIDRDTIAVRGYLGISLLGQTQTWKRMGE
jgi:uncharacterized protein (DUF2147 family)